MSASKMVHQMLIHVRDNRSWDRAKRFREKAIKGLKELFYAPVYTYTACGLKPASVFIYGGNGRYVVVEREFLDDCLTELMTIKEFSNLDEAKKEAKKFLNHLKHIFTRYASGDDLRIGVELIDRYLKIL